MSKSIQDEIMDLKEQGLSWVQIATRLNLASMEVARGKVRGTPRYKEFQQRQGVNVEKSQTREFNNDGSIGSQIRVRQQQRKVFSNEELIRLHGFNPDEVKLKTATSNEWTTPTNGETYYNYQSKIVVVPKRWDMSAQDVKKIFGDIPQRKIELLDKKIPNEYLLIPLSDLHFGHNSHLDYLKLQREIAERIMNRYKEILITLHGDYFHVDNFLNTTERGTRVDDVDFEAGLKAGYDFLSPLLDLALENSPNVKVVYLKGNHAPSVDYLFVSMLEHIYPQIKFDVEIKEFKHAWLGNHSIFMHHGDKVKSPNKLFEIMVSHFGEEWGKSQSRYLITGHFHHEKSLSFAGLIWYQLQSPSKHSSYDKTYGYDTSESGQMLFEFSETKRSAIYYV